MPKDLQAFEGEKARFACSVSVDGSTDTSAADVTRADYWSTADTGGGGGGSLVAGGGVQVVWHRNDVPLRLDSRMTVLPSGKLHSLFATNSHLEGRSFLLIA